MSVLSPLKHIFEDSEGDTESPTQPAKVCGGDRISPDHTDEAAESGSTPTITSHSTGLPAVTNCADPICIVMPAQVLNSTAPVGEFLAAALSIRQAFADAREASLAEAEVYEEFGTKLEQLLRRYGHVGFDLTGRIVLLEGTDPKLGLSALRAASQVHDSNVEQTRLNLASSALDSSVPEHRYGALHVLADVGNLAALQQLISASQTERIAALRADIERLISLLRRD